MDQTFISNVSFIKSITNIKDKPEPRLPEMAVVGRSNVGKSSLINSIFNQKKLAKTSSTPGKTRLINYFDVANTLYFVDLPGYGYAKAAKQDAQKWKVMIESYLSNNPDLKMVLLLIDSRRGILPIDEVMIKWLEYYNIKFTVILTKSDKISNNEMTKVKSKIKKQLKEKNIISFSIKSEKGRIELINLLNYELNLN